jgi:hypothetical protein
VNCQTRRRQGGIAFAPRFPTRTATTASPRKGPPLSLALALLCVSVLACAAWGGRPVARTRGPATLCLEHYKEVVVLLQAGRKWEAQARALLIRCAHLRAQALGLCQRSRPVA